MKIRFTQFLLSGTFLLGLWSAPFSHAQPLLRWGADSEGGPPCVYRDPSQPEIMVGFEVELVDLIAKELQMAPLFVQNQWDGLVAGLTRGNYDIIVNGLEITEDRKQVIHFSKPYYVTYETLAVRKEESKVQGLDDLKGRPVGTLKFSLAQTILEKHGGLQVLTYESEVNAYSDLEIGRVDAVLLDDSISRYHALANPKLKLVGQPLGHMEYGIGVRKSDRALLERINGALDHLTRSGKLRELYDRWNLWNPLMEDYFKGISPPVAYPARPIRYEAFLKSKGIERTLNDRIKQYGSYLPLLLQGAKITLEISILSMLLAVSFGLLVALGRLYGGVILRVLSLTYVEVMRGTPLLVQLFLIFYGLPLIGIKLTPLFAAVLGLGLNYAAYEAENYRAGIVGIPRGQMDAALALGMTRVQSLVHVVIPQAVRLVIPPVTNDFISLLKDSSIVSVITMVELTKIYGQLASTTYDYLGIGILTALLYLIMGLPFVRLARWVEKTMSFGYSLDQLQKQQ